MLTNEQLLVVRQCAEDFVALLDQAIDAAVEEPDGTNLINVRRVAEPMAQAPRQSASFSCSEFGGSGEPVS